MEKLFSIIDNNQVEQKNIFYLLRIYLDDTELPILATHILNLLNFEEKMASLWTIIPTNKDLRVGLAQRILQLQMISCWLDRLEYLILDPTL